MARELGEASKQDLKTMHDTAVKLFNEDLIGDRSSDIVTLQDALMEAWALGHNQGYEDANEERDSR